MGKTIGSEHVHLPHMLCMHCSIAWQYIVNEREGATEQEYAKHVSEASREAHLLCIA
jgi:hypothetical protein